MIVKLKFTEITNKTLDKFSLMQRIMEVFKISKENIGIKVRLFEFLKFGLTTSG